MRSRIEYSPFSAYPAICEDLMSAGEKVESRGGSTYEIENYTVMMRDPVHLVPRRPGLNPLLGQMEGTQLVGAVATPRLMDRCWPKMASFTDHYGDYGARAGMGDQMRLVFEMLRTNPDSRQAIINLWSPELDMYGNALHSDHPCTLTIGFRVRNRKLNMSVTMRSNDIWLGTSSDFTQFAMLQLTWATALGYEVGTYTHTAYSMHMYSRDVDKIKQFLRAPKERFEPKHLQPLSNKGWTYGEICTEAQNVLFDDGTCHTDLGKQLKRDIRARLSAIADAESRPDLRLIKD